MGEYSLPLPFGLPTLSIPEVFPFGWALLLVLILGVTAVAWRRLKSHRRTSGAGSHPVFLTPGEGRVVNLYGRFGGTRVWMSGLIPTPASVVPDSRRFVQVLIVTFLGLSTIILILFSTVITIYDQLLASLATLLFWPLASPLTTSTGGVSPIAPDYIFPMYLSAMIAFSVASGLWSNDPPRALHRRTFAVLVLFSYLLVAMIIDVLFLTYPDPILLGFAPVIRIFTGGLFLSMLILSAVHLPTPQDMRAWFPRARGDLGVFFALGLLALLGALFTLYLLAYFVPPQQFLFGVTVLLLLPFLTLTYFILLAHGRYGRLLRKRPRPPLWAYHPPISIIVPAFNEEEWIEWTLFTADQAAAKYPGPVQLVVAVDGSTDRTLAIAQRSIRLLKHCKGMVLDLPHGGKSSALNSALAVATGEIIIRCDGDTFIDPNKGFSALIPHFADPAVGGVQGAIHPRQRDGWTRKMRAMEIAWNHYFLRPAGMATRSAEVIDGLFSAFRRRDLVALGGWVPWNGEDSEISLRVQRLGYQIRIEDDALAYEDVPENYRQLRRQRIRWARGILMANGQHYPSLLGDTPEFGGLGIFFWYLFFLRSGVRGLVVAYLVLLLVLVGIPALLGMAIVVAFVLSIRMGPVAYYLVVRMGRSDVLKWLICYPAMGFIKQTFQLEALGYLGPTAVAEYAV